MNRMLTVALAGVLPVALMAQQPKIGHLRAYDQTGINVFEDLKSDSVPFDGLKVRFGAGFTQQFQNLKHENPGALNNNVGAYPGVSGNKLKVITAGFQTAQANLFMDVQLADGIRLNVTSYLSSKHHNETWVKGGYIQFDKLPFKGKIWSDIMKITTIKIGHFEVDYGDEHYRRTDGGQALYNPFMEGNVMDEFATEIGGEVYVKKNGFFGMFGLTNGMIKGNVDSLYAAKNPDGNLHKSPSVLLKAGFDKKLADNVRLRMSLSYYGNQSSGGNTLFGGDRTGSNYQFVMEENSANPSSATGAGTPLAFSGRFNPGFSKKINAVMFNTFFKVSGFELFGTLETASGRSATETSNRTASQYAIDGVYRFGKKENLFIGARYNSVKAGLANNAAGTGAGPIVYTNDVTVNRFALAGGWFLTRNVLLKAEYVNQVYNNFPAADYRAGGKFYGYVIEAVVGF
ncbi:MAG: hypothetical protein KGO81_06890 [Bacteroidota bacterium]|nr:hypothetical protein [Bacteroidota bacterium]